MNLELVSHKPRNSDIVVYIKAKRLAWAGQLTRMSDERTLKKLFNTKSDGTRSVGRPKLRWGDGVAQNMQILGVKRRVSPSTETNGQNFLRRANDDNDDKPRN
jgi:hypothetical protein